MTGGVARFRRDRWGAVTGRIRCPVGVRARACRVLGPRMVQYQIYHHPPQVNRSPILPSADISPRTSLPARLRFLLRALSVIRTQGGMVRWLTEAVTMEVVMMTPRLQVLAISVVSLAPPSTQYYADCAVMSRCKSVSIGIGERAVVKHQGEWISPVSRKSTY